MAVGKRRTKSMKSRNSKGYFKLSMASDETGESSSSQGLSRRKKIFTSVTLIMGTTCIVAALLILFVVDSKEDSGSAGGNTKSVSSSFETHVPQNISGQTLLDIAELSDIYHFKKIELNGLLLERVPDTDGIRVARAHIISRINSLGGWTIEEDTFTSQTPLGNKQFVNVIATLRPTVKRRLVIACHYDSKYFAPSVNTEDFIGATDSAVPCAMMLDAIYNLDSRLKNDELQDDVTLQLLFLDGEEAFVEWTNEDSLYGARHLANKMASTPLSSGKSNLNQIHQIDMFVLLDLIGAADPVFRNNFRKTSKWFKHLGKIETTLRNAEVIPQRTQPYFATTSLYGRYNIQDDHLPFLQRDVPILHLIAYPFPTVWHTTADNESALDYETIADLNKIIQIFIADYLYLAPASQS